MSQTALYIGIMSGTSLDGIDIVLVDFATSSPALLHSLLIPYPTELRRNLQQISQPGSSEIELLGLLEAQLAEAYAFAVQQLLAKADIEASQISAIGCHGQTIRHRPDAVWPFSYQIGDMHRLAARTCIRVIADFRRKDIAYGGQGAPLVPAFHQAIFADPLKRRCILNIGGIANITLLLPNQPVQGFDTGPGNCLLDSWIMQQQGQEYDAEGQYGESGQLQSDLLASLLADPYFAKTGPKSTGREYFQLQWLQSHLQQHPCPPADVQRTLCRFTASTIANSLADTSVEQVFVCGGGALNPLLMTDLQQLLAPAKLCTTLSLGVAPDWVEAMAFAWLAFAFDQNIPGNIPAVTGASRAVRLGVEFLP